MCVCACVCVCVLVVGNWPKILSNLSEFDLRIGTFLSSVLSPFDQTLLNFRKKTPEQHPRRSVVLVKFQTFNCALLKN